MNYNIEGYLCNYGLCIKQKSIDISIQQIIKNYFNVKPELNYENEKIPEKDKYFNVYYSDNKYIILPKFSSNIIISILKLNNNKSIKILNNDYCTISFSIKKFKFKKYEANFEFNGQLRDYQEVIIKEIFNKFGLDLNMPNNHQISNSFPKGGIIKLSCGGGKCLGFDTPILMFNGNIKMVQNIIIGDKLMGDNSQPRNVLNIARGREMMYKVIKEDGESYIVNSSHILSLYDLKNKKIVDIGVQDYLKLENKFIDSDEIKFNIGSYNKNLIKGGLYGYRVRISFKNQTVPFNSYLFGYIISNTNILNNNNYSHSEIKNYFISKNLISKPRIPLEFKANCYEIQLNLLAGIIDSVGIIKRKSFYLLINKINYEFFDDIIYIIKSLGLDFISDKKSKFYKIILYGQDAIFIPTKIKCIYSFKTKQIINIQNLYLSYFSEPRIIPYKINVIPMSTDNYYGFEIDGNHRFVLADFTVSHNTMLAIYLSWKLGLKTLVVTHKEFLMDQWEKRIKQFSNAKVGRIRQNNIDIDNKDIVIGMLRSLSIKNYPNDIMHQFGLVIYDEVHHTGSRVDSQALLKTSAEYTIGLSATPDRSDGMTKIINWHIGDILYEMEKKYSYKVLVKKIFFRSNDILFNEKTRWFDHRMAPNHNAMTNNIIKIKTRNQLICNFIDTLKNMGRKILILSFRVEHLELLKAIVDTKITEDGESHIYNSYYYMGNTKRGEKDMAEKDGHIIFATMQLAEEGLDIGHLDTIIFALPVSIQKDKKNTKKIKSSKTLIQSIGRILRNDKLEDLTRIPLVVDISDLFSIYLSWSNKRNEIYNNKNWFVQNYYWEDLNYIYQPNQDITIKPMNIIFDDIFDEDFIEKNLILPNDSIKHNSSDELNSDNSNKINNIENKYQFGKIFK